MFSFSWCKIIPSILVLNAYLSFMIKYDFEHFSENLLTVTDLRSRRRPDRIVVGFINIRIGNMFCQ
jgi:hypothetical protein